MKPKNLACIFYQYMISLKIIKYLNKLNQKSDLKISFFQSIIILFYYKDAFNCIPLGIISVATVIGRVETLL